MKTIYIYLILLLALIICTAASLSMGAMYIPVSYIIHSIADAIGLSDSLQADQAYQTVLYLVRLPRVLQGLLIGAALGISGAAIQGVFRNPLAEPGLIGISSGASLFAVVVIALEVTVFATLSSLLGYYLVSVSAFLGAAFASWLIYRISQNDGRPHIATMILAGVAINALAAALTGLITANAEEHQLRTITFWMLGSMAGATWQTLLACSPFIILPLLLLPMYARPLNTFVLGEKQADQLGMRTSRVKLRVIILATMAVGASVSVSGIIGFVGLIVPHLIRLIGGVDNRFVLPASALAGALVLSLADLLARVISAPIEQPIGVITALLGAPVFMYILIKDKKKLASG